MNLYLGVDFGTEGVRTALFDEEGKLHAMESEGYPTYYPRAGWVEQNPDDWWNAFLKATHRLVKRSANKSKDISGMACDTTSCTVLLLDRMFRPLGNALIWMDVRASRQAERIARSNAAALKYNGHGSVSAEWMPSKLLWLKEQQPDLYKASVHACEFQDYVNRRITGEWTGSLNNVTIRWYYDSTEGGWPVDFYRRIGLEDAIDRFPSPVLAPGEVIGTITREVAEATGLPPGLTVVQGGVDAYMGMLGLGAVRPGRVAFITGSSHLLLGPAEKGFHHKGVFGAFPDAVLPGMWVLEGGQISTGSILKWFKDRFTGYDIVREARKKSVSVYDYLNTLAGEIRPGSEGLIVLDYWQGNRNPLTDSRARGTVWGLSLRHTPAHVYRGIMEGVAYGTAHIMRTFHDAGYTPETLVACGGATKSRLWMQIHCDVLGMPIHLTQEQDAPLLGDAILAAHAVGGSGSIQDTTERMVKTIAGYEPDLARHEAYGYYVDRYIDTYDRMKELMWDMAAHERAEG